MCSDIAWQADDLTNTHSLQILQVPESAGKTVMVGVVVCTKGVLRDWAFYSPYNLAITFVFSARNLFDPR